MGIIKKSLLLQLVGYLYNARSYKQQHTVQERYIGCQLNGNASLNTACSKKFYLSGDTAQHYWMPEHSLKKYFNVHRRTNVLSVTQTVVIIPTYYSSENVDGTVIAKLDCSDTICRSCWHFIPLKTVRQAEILTSD